MAHNIGRAIRILREAKKLNLGQLAETASMSSSYLSLVEAGQRNPSVDTLTRVAVALDVPCEFFLMLAGGVNTSLTSSEDRVNRLLVVFARLESLQQELHDAIT